MTRYFVLKQEGEQWDPFPNSIDARSARSAIQKMIDEVGGGVEGSFVAIPTRSWKPVSVKVETKTQLKFS